MRCAIGVTVAVEVIAKVLQIWRADRATTRGLEVIAGDGPIIDCRKGAGFGQSNQEFLSLATGLPTLSPKPKSIVAIGFPGAVAFDMTRPAGDFCRSRDRVSLTPYGTRL
ncbi:hypothetical protein [Nocardia terrae]|uniref:hypothetical protein n=1 Tax=Nocardia terrae TaxID=2675851 RepID=UPI0038B24E94